MRWLLDEHLSPAIADRLGSLGHDAQAVARRPDLRGATDAALMVAATAEHRVVVTADVADFSRLAARLTATGEIHTGVVLVAAGSFPPNARSIGRVVSALDALARSVAADGLDGRVAWLRDEA